MNVAQLQPVSAPQVLRISNEAADKDAGFLAFKLVNRRARVRLSPEPLDLNSLPGRAQLFAIANSKGWFAAVTRNADSSHHLVFSPLSALYSTLSSASDEETPLPPQRTLAFPAGTPTTIAFACKDTRLLVSIAQGQVLVYDAAPLLSPGTEDAQPIWSFPSPAPGGPRQILPNTGDMPDLVAVLHQTDVEIVDVQKLQPVSGWRTSGTPETTPTTLTWSPKGKQIAIGMQNGDVICFAPSSPATPKSLTPRPPAAEGKSVISASWLSTPTFHTIYAPPGPLTSDSDQTHFILSLDSKANTATDVKLNTPYYPMGPRPPGAFVQVLRNWDPAKILLVIADSTSSDIGAIACLEDDAWYNLELEDTSRPAMPLDKDMNDTVVCAFDIDFTSTQPYSHTGVDGASVEIPPTPILYAYGNDGTILGWNIVNAKGIAYPGMLGGAAPAMNSTPFAEPMKAPEISMGPAMSREPSTTEAAQSGFGSGFGQSAFGQSSAFGQNAASPSAFGGGSGSGFGQTSAFGANAGSTNAFGANSNSNTFGGSSGGFGAFAGTSKFGQSGFGFGGAGGSSSAAGQAAPITPATPIDTDARNVLGGLSLGGDGPRNPPPANAGTAGMFGAAASAPPPASTTSASAFGSSSAFKPATGFGAFGAGASTGGGFSAFSNPAPASANNTFDAAKAAPGFGQSAFGKPSFGASAFGNAAAPAGGAGTGASGGFASFAGGTSSFASAAQAASGSAFGQSSFGQSSFGQTAKPAETKPAPTVNAFSAFAQGGPTSLTGSSGSTPSAGGFASFGRAGPSPFSTASADSKPAATGGFAAFGQGGTSAFGQASENKPAPSPFAAPQGEKQESAESTPKPLFGQGSAFGAKSAFGGAAFGSKPVADEDKEPATPPDTPEAQTKAIPGLDESPGTPPEGTPSSTPSSAPPASAFAGLGNAAPAFRAGQGFGAFGGIVNKDSPFFSPPKPTNPSAFKPTSAFAPATPPAAGSAAPTFGAPSAFGQRSAFASPTTPAGVPPAKAEVPATGGFAGFSGGGGFGAAGGAGKSFSDLLKEGKPAAGTAPKSAFASTGTPPKSAFASASTTPKAEPPSEEGVKVKKEEEPAPMPPPKSETKPSTPEEKKPTLSAESSFASIGDLNESFTEIPTPKVEEAEDESEGGEDAEGSGEEDGPEDDASSFLSEEFAESGESEELSEDETEDVEGNEEPVPPASPSKEEHEAPSTTPSASAEKGKERDSRSPTPKPTTAATPPGVPEPGTPPGSPTKEEPGKPVAAPTPVTPGAFGFGLGKPPASRPARSSPLASAPIVGGSGAEDKDKKPPFATPFKAHPASPKPLFGAWDPKAGGSAPAMPTPSLSSPFAPNAAKAGSSPFAMPSLSIPVAAPPKSAFSAAPPPSFGLGAQKSPSPSVPSGAAETKPALGMPAFSFAKPAAPSPQPPLSAGGSKPASPAPATSFFGPIAAPAVPSPFKLSPSPAPAPPSGGFFTGAPSPMSGPSKAATPPTPAPAPAPMPTPAPPSITQGMQSECAYLFMTLAKELEDLRALAQDAAKKKVDLGRPAGGSREVARLSDRSKWSLGDLAQFGQTMRQVQQDVKDLEERRAVYQADIRRIESDMLKANMRKEEIARFNRAKTDAEFAKMLKIRTLGPEHLETQNQLRRDIRIMRDRVQRLEDHLQSSKKRLNEMKTGKPHVKPPTLDTLNRTYRNIDAAIDQMVYNVDKFETRVKQLNLGASQGASTPIPSTRSSRKSTTLNSSNAPSTGARRVDNDASPASRSAYRALAAERAADRFKEALFESRAEPLLNSTAVHATNASIPSVFGTPQQGESNASTSPGAPPATPAPASTFAGFGAPTPAPSTPDWSLPAFAFDADASPAGGTSPSLRQRGAGSTKHHQKPVQLKKTPQGPVANPSPPPGFSWGPLPNTASPSPKAPFSFAGFGSPK